MMPDEEMQLEPGDCVLFCGAYGIAGLMRWVLQNTNVLHYVVTGDEGPAGYIWQWLNNRRQTANNK